MVGDVPVTMLKIFLSVLMTASFFMDVRAYNIVLQLPNFNETENLTVIEDNDNENRNNTSAGNTTDYFYIDFPKIGYQIFKNKMAQAMETYESFMNKNPVILKVDKSNFSTNETINLTILNDNKTDNVIESLSNMQQNSETNTESPLKVNTTEIYENTPQNFSESSNVTQNQTNYSLPVLETGTENKTAGNETANEGNKTVSFFANNTGNVEENNTVINEENRTAIIELNTTLSIDTNKTTIDEEKKPEIAPVGFFENVSNTVSNFFHSLTSWF